MSHDRHATFVRIGTAGWAIPRAVAGEFPAEGSALARYSSVFDAVEINSTFRRSHQSKTHERWRDSVPPTFRFSVKTPESLTHDARLVDCAAGVCSFLAEVSSLGAKLGPILLQLPPSLAFDANVVEIFCQLLGQDGRFTLACEPRHASWFNAEVDEWLAERRIARVAADPALHPGAGEPGGWRGLSYYRLHGSPRVYYSSYDAAQIVSLHERWEKDDANDKWCIFDNTASGVATSNALALRARIAQR
ncbi:MAG: DUF72 domain-containing protein [Gemmatimonadaceae bacterium]|nr:DUF72 domain-containing protein [Gemmatimonadaceae bacterium]